MVLCFPALLLFVTDTTTIAMMMIGTRDTGSSNLWVASSFCVDKGCSHMNKYNASASDTAHADGEPWYDFDRDRVSVCVRCGV